MKAKFSIDQSYTRKEIRTLLDIENPQNIGGIWSTGYISYKDEFYIFATISNAGRTGHDYGNILDKRTLYWYTKRTDHFYVPTIQKMVSGKYPVHIFTRFDSNNPSFVYQGTGCMVDFENGKPAFIAWSLNGEEDQSKMEIIAQNRKKFIEGKKILRTVIGYERDPKAREACLKYYGCVCKVCNFNFEKSYGDIGKDFIHVHHEKELSMINENYEIDPIKDMKPVCPNCHSMLHRRKPAYSMSELRDMIESLK
ncbi:HNH endonuclease [Enterococcus casseliflavus]|jgi:5-methylcytosine-specific restriction enzyme A